MQESVVFFEIRKNFGSGEWRQHRKYGCFDMGFFHKAQDIGKDRGVVRVGAKDKRPLDTDTVVVETFDSVLVFSDPID